MLGTQPRPHAATAHLVPKGTEPPQPCPGTVSAPKAKPGHLCVYEGGEWSQGGSEVLDPRTQASPGTSRWGFLVRLGPGFTGNTYGFETHGTWAVTAP